MRQRGWAYILYDTHVSNGAVNVAQMTERNRPTMMTSRALTFLWLPSSGASGGTTALVAVTEPKPNPGGMHKYNIYMYMYICAAMHRTQNTSTILPIRDRGLLCRIQSYGMWSREEVISNHISLA